MQDLQGRAVKGLAWRGTSTILQFVFGILLTLILMRYISPEDYGLIAKLLIVLGLFNICLNLGFSQALVQQEEFNQKNLSSHFWGIMAVASLLSIILFFTSNLISVLYQESRLAFPFKLFSITLITGGSIIVHRSILFRELKFNKIAIIDIVSFIISGIVAIYFAITGYGYQAIVIQLILNNIIQTVFYWFLSAFKPKIYFDIKHLVNTSSFSLYIFLNALIKFFADLLDQFLISIKFEQSVLGVYNRSVSLVKTGVKIFPSSVETVLFPLFSRLNETEEIESSIESIYYRVSSLMVLIFFPLLILFNLYAFEIVELIIGTEWLELIPYIKIISLTALLYVLNFEGSIFLSKGHSKEWMWLNGIDKFILITAVLVGINFGIIYLLWSILVAELITRILHLVTIYKMFKIDVLFYVKQLLLPFIGVLIYVGIIYFINLKVNPSKLILFLILSSSYLIYLCLNIIAPVNGAAIDLKRIGLQILSKK